MADKLTYNQILENKKFIDDLLNNEELNLDDKEELEYVWQSLVSREESKFDAIISVIKDCDKQISMREKEIVELKRNQTSDDTVGQILRYMGWIEEKKQDENVKGIIVAGKFDEKLKYAKTMVPNSEAFLYEVNFQIKEYK